MWTPSILGAHFPRSLWRFKIFLPPLPAAPLFLLPLCSHAADQTQSLACARQAVFFFNQEGSLRHCRAITCTWNLCRTGEELSVWPGSLSFSRSQVIWAGHFITRELASSCPSPPCSHGHPDSLPDTLMSERNSLRHILLIRFPDPMNYTIILYFWAMGTER